MVDLSFLSSTYYGIDAALNCPCTKRSITDCCIHYTYLQMNSPSHAQIKMPSPWFLFSVSDQRPVAQLGFDLFLYVRRTHKRHTCLQVTPVWIKRIIETKFRFFLLFTHPEYDRCSYAGWFAEQQEKKWADDACFSDFGTQHTPSFS